MTNVTIFKQQDVAVSGPRESALGKKFSSAGITSRRIQANINGTFKRVVNGEQVGNAVRGEINVIIVGALENVSRIFYKEKFDPNKEATLPNCWSNMGDVPDPKAPDPQSASCSSCSQNIKGSGDGGGKACRYQRRISVMLAGDPSGDIYQFNIPAKSLFGKGTGNVHPFESYAKFLTANGEALDTVVTNISFDSNADTMELVFSPQRILSDEEYELVKVAQTRPETDKYTRITVAQTDGVTKKPNSEPKQIEMKAKVTRTEEPEEEEAVVAEPVKRSKKTETATPTAKKNLADIANAWGDE